MPEKWIHINTSVGDPWILPIWGAVNDAVSSRKVTPLPKEVSSQLGLSISTRLDMLPRIVNRINDEVNKVYKATKTHGPEHVFTLEKEGYVFDIDENLKFNFLIDIDSLLFELNSVCELMTSLFYVLYANMCKKIKKKDVGLSIKRIIEASGNSSEWFQELDSQRNFFMHETAPYFAVDISKGLGKYDLLIMRENIKVFNDHSKFIKMSEINSVVQGFALAKPVIQRHLIELYRQIP